MGDGDDPATLAWRVSKIEDLIHEQRKDRATLRLFLLGLGLNSCLTIAGLLVNARVL